MFGTEVIGPHMTHEWRKTMNRHEETELFLNEQEGKGFSKK